jgi:hypothetical protein
MSLGIIIKNPAGIVLAADSRITAEIKKNEKIAYSHFDNANKLLHFSAPHDQIGVITFGQATIANRPPSSFIPEIEQVLGKDEPLRTVQEYVEVLSEFFTHAWREKMPRDYKGPELTFIVCGFNKDESYGRAYQFSIPFNINPIELGTKEVTLTYGGDIDILHRLISGFDIHLLNAIKNDSMIDDLSKKKIEEHFHHYSFQIPLEVLALQDAVDLARLLIDVTIKVQQLTIGVRTVGGPVDIAIIERGKPIYFIQEKVIK